MITLSASCLILVLIYVGFSKWITIPIQKLKDGMEQIQKGYLDTRIKIGRNDEIGLLGEGLNEMAAQLETYIEQVYGAELRQREAELNALKTQIKPHYLYNTLDIIRMTALTNEDMQTARMIESLAGQLRYLIGSSSDKVCLEEELQNIKNYFTMIKIRYEERFDLKLSVPERLQKAMILKLSIQPFVENAVAHGLKFKTGQGMVWISARQNEDILELTVMDDGVGIQPEKLAKLQSQIDCVEGTAELSKASGGVGICNVQERIRKNFGPQYGIEIKSTEQTGTIVILRFPCLFFPEGGVTNVPGSTD
nr:sensor histidine kinase [Clostridium sp. MCC353]